MYKQLDFYIIRHGRTEWNERGLLQGHGDSPLTKAGIAGAKATADALSDIDFTAAYSSELPRAFNTAKLIIGDRTLPIITLAGLNEQAFGTWEGQHITQLSALSEFHAMRTDPMHYHATTNGGETFEQLYHRVTRCMHTIIHQHQHGAILLVSHGHTLRLLLHSLQGGSWQTHRDPTQSFSVLNTAINHVRYTQLTPEANGTFKMLRCNDTSHLSVGSF
ncbi:histidine phosphatase family protein [Spirabiliibacterium falconis]|uniref:histidine phosphatase family protein n=1 Tax=Spirabiliibacterium falconis TaxID=572023 RepID=UPI001AAD7579|nr:histidine phosphatase family protein [Spirabiliibacterium falconis]MBE2894098.1 histidine phosphatase family protein [Spirabiliibacterium falconis]